VKQSYFSLSLSLISDIVAASIFFNLYRNKFYEMPTEILMKHDNFKSRKEKLCFKNLLKNNRYT